MNFSQINWKTTGYAIGFFVCYLVGKFIPAAESLCEVVGSLIITGGLVSSADADRVKSIVRAVDVISWKNNIDPATLAPLHPEVTKP